MPSVAGMNTRDCAVSNAPSAPKSPVPLDASEEGASVEKPGKRGASGDAPGVCASAHERSEHAAETKASAWGRAASWTPRIVAGRMVESRARGVNAGIESRRRGRKGRSAEGNVLHLATKVGD